MAPAAGATILHADLDAFYASVEQLLDPSLRGKPIAVGGGVVLAASYEAKAFGVHGAMNGRRARQLCPQLIFVDGHFSEYTKFGDAVMAVLGDFTPWVERVSIDEAFLDVSGSTHLFGTPAEIAQQIRARVRDEIGLPISVGVATTKHLAKVASQVAKPDFLVVVEPGDERAFLDPLPVQLLWGIGPSTTRKLAEAGIRTIGELHAAEPARVQRLLGTAVGEKLGFLAANEDPRAIETSRRAKSVGAQSALGRRVVTEQLLQETLGFLADRVATRLRASGHAGRTVTVRVRFRDLRAITRSRTVDEAISSTSTLRTVCVELVKTALADNPREREVSLLAISVSNLANESELQLALGLGDDESNGSEPPEIDRIEHPPRALDEAMDRARARFGRDAVGFATVVFRDGAGVPDAFRELAEKDR
ncbi:MAG: DNA polymerase IV [Acidimicrobiia bacterium]